jgi:hypothetical protein
MSHHEKHIISPREVMVDLKHSALNNCHVLGCHPSARLECFVRHLTTTQSISAQLLPDQHQHNTLTLL